MTNRTFIINILLAILFSVYLPLIQNFSFFYSHVFFILWIIVIFVNNYQKLPKKMIRILFISVLFLVLTIWLSIFIDVGDRFLQDNVKIFIYIFSITILSSLVKTKTLMSILQGMIIILPFVLIFYILFQMQTNLFSYADRLYLPYFGSPNVLGAIAALCIIILYFSNNISIFIKVVLILFYSLIVILGFSRAVILGIIVALALNKKVRMNLIYLSIILLFLAIVLLSFNIINIPDWVYIKLGLMDGAVSVYEDARFIVWSATFSQIFDNYLSFIFGTLPGKGIVVLPGHVDMTMHPHNTYLFVIWSYGIIGLLLFLTSLFFLVYKLHKEDTLSDLKKTLLLFYLIVFFMDTYILAGQFLIFHVLIWSLLYSTNVLQNTITKEKTIEK